MDLPRGQWLSSWCAYGVAAGPVPAAVAVAAAVGFVIFRCAQNWKQPAAFATMFWINYQWEPAHYLESYVASIPDAGMCRGFSKWSDKSDFLQCGAPKNPLGIQIV